MDAARDLGRCAEQRETEGSRARGGRLVVPPRREPRSREPGEGERLVPERGPKASRRTGLRREARTRGARPLLGTEIRDERAARTRRELLRRARVAHVRDEVRVEASAPARVGVEAPALGARGGEREGSRRCVARGISRSGVAELAQRVGGERHVARLVVVHERADARALGVAGGGEGFPVPAREVEVRLLERQAHRREKGRRPALEQRVRVLPEVVGVRREVREAEPERAEALEVEPAVALLVRENPEQAPAQTGREAGPAQPRRGKELDRLELVVGEARQREPARGRVAERLGRRKRGGAGALRQVRPARGAQAAHASLLRGDEIARRGERGELRLELAARQDAQASAAQRLRGREHFRAE